MISVYAHKLKAFSLDVFNNKMPFIIFFEDYVGVESITEEQL